MKHYEIHMQAFKDSVLSTINTVILPIGTTEAHGLHCPMGTDAMLPKELAHRVEERIGVDKILVAPTVNFGHSWYLGTFPGTIDVSSETLGQYLFEIGRSYFKWGLTKIVFLNGHGGNAAALSMASEKLVDLGAETMTVHWWTDYRKEILEICTAQGHAGEDETAAVMGIFPELVSLELVGEPHFERTFVDIKVQNRNAHTYPMAYSGDPGLATEAKGRKILEAVSGALAKHVRKFQMGQYVD